MLQLAVLAASVFFSWNVAYADEPGAKFTINSLFGRFGYTMRRSAAKECDVTMVLDRRKFVEAMPQLIAVGLINPEFVTQSRLNLMPTTLAFGFSLKMVPAVLKDFYEDDAKVDRCTFRQFVTITDDYGNDKNETAFSFNLSRQLFSRINWDKFDPTKMPKIFPNFTYGQELASMGAEEKDAYETIFGN